MFVQPFPDPASGKWQISGKGGAYPRWRRDGREVYYLDEAGRLMAVSIATEARFELERSIPVFDTSLNLPMYPFGSAYPYDAAPDGQRFLVSVPLAGATSVPLSVTLNWTSALKH